MSKADEKAGRASSLRAEAFSLVAFPNQQVMSSVFGYLHLVVSPDQQPWAMQKVSRKKGKKTQTCWCRYAKTPNKGRKDKKKKEKVQM